MVRGFNHNVKHRAQLHHVQTEDSGPGNAVITTHLFIGGNILATARKSYRELIGAENLAELVRKAMEEQHKEMLRNLVNGVYDAHADALAAQARSYQPGQLAPAAASGPIDAPATPPPAVQRPPPLPSRAAQPPTSPDAPPVLQRVKPPEPKKT